MNILKKRNLFDVLKIDRNDPDRYKKVVDYISSYDDRFCIDVMESALTNQYHVDDRILNKTDVISQLIEIKNEGSIFFDTLFEKRSCGYAHFQYTMKQIGVDDYTVEDWAHISKRCFEKIIEESPFMFGWKSCLASYIGHFDIDNDEYKERLPELEAYKQDYIASRNQGKSIAFIRDRDDILKYVANVEQFPEELVTKLTKAYRVHIQTDCNGYWTKALEKVRADFKDEIEAYSTFEKQESEMEQRI